MAAVRGVSDRQFIETIIMLHKRNKFCPSYQEIADEFGVTVGRVLERIHTLEAEGKLSTKKGQGNSSTRTLRVTNHDCPNCGGSGYSTK